MLKASCRQGATRSICPENGLGIFAFGSMSLILGNSLRPDELDEYVREKLETLQKKYYQQQETHWGLFQSLQRCLNSARLS